MCKPYVITNDVIDKIWDKGIIVDGFNPARYRKDACGAWIDKEQYGNTESDFGWEIDHIVPMALLEQAGVPEKMIFDIRNLRPFNCRNNRSKGKDYPVYHANVTSNGRRNVSDRSEVQVNEKIQQELRVIYQNYISL